MNPYQEFHKLDSSMRLQDAWKQISKESVLEAWAKVMNNLARLLKEGCFAAENEIELEPKDGDEEWEPHEEDSD
jgi:hypothetical protein